MPVTLYVPTLFIDSPDRVPLGRLTGNHLSLKPMTWDILRMVASSPLVTLAAHSHEHKDCASLSDREIEQGIQISFGRFREELDFSPRHFAYPRGAWNARTEAIVSKHYDSAALVGFDADPSDGGEFRVGRIAILRSDKVFWFSHQVRQHLGLEEHIARAIRVWRRGSDSHGYG